MLAVLKRVWGVRVCLSKRGSNQCFWSFQKTVKVPEFKQLAISRLRLSWPHRIWPMGPSEHQPATGRLAQMTLEANSEVKAEAKFDFVLSGEKLGF